MSGDDHAGATGRGAPRPPADGVGPVGLLAFACEVALVVLLGVAGWRLGTATGLAVPLGVALALALPAATIVVWGRWLAPRAAHRLSQPWRLDVQVAVFAAGGLVVALTGLVWWGVGLAVVGPTAFALSRDH